MKNWIIVLVLGFIFACGSTQKNAQEKLEAGEYQSAMELFERVVGSDPNNAEAKEGLKRARAGVLGERLIGVRKARDAGNADAALDQLLTVVELEKSWNQFPSAAARFTQEEETQFAWKPFQAKLNRLIQSKQPLVAELNWKRFAPVFSGSKNTAAYQAFGPQIARAGREHCSALLREASAEEPYYANFVGRYCRYWKADVKKVANLDRARLSGLVSGIEWKGKLENLPAEYAGILRADLEAALKQSAWYDPNGTRKISLELQGNYNFTHSKNLVSRVREYQVKESYQAVEPVEKTRQVPVESISYQTDPATGLTKPVKTTTMKTEKYTVNETVTKMRQVPRQFPYSALFHQQAIQMNSAVLAQIGSQSFTITEANQATAEGDEQNLKNDEVGLTPMKPNLIDTAGWVRGESAKVKNQFVTKLREEWIAQNCNASENAKSVSDVGERALKCRREPTAGNLPLVESWYSNTFGLSQNDVESLLADRK